MPAASRMGDISTGHNCFPPTAIITTPVTKTYLNGLLAAVVDAELLKHKCGRSFHFSTRNRKISSGSSNIFIEGKAAARIGDEIECGDNLGQGSSNIIFGG